MAKLTEEQKAKRAETRKLNKLKKEQEEAVSIRLSCIERLKDQCIPEPTRSFEVGELVVRGRHDNTKILEKFDGGKFYEVHSWGVVKEGSKNAGSHTETKAFVEWFDLFKLESRENDTELFQRAKVKIDYFSCQLHGLLISVYTHGINFDPPYQRGIVWDDEDKTKLLDSVFADRNIGGFVINQMDYPYKDQIIDGKQRLTTLCEFYEDRFVWRGKKYSDLSLLDRRQFLHKVVSKATVYNFTDKEAMEVFLYVNDTGKPIDPKHIERVRDEFNKQ